jgi:hypothetical protein
MNYSRALFVLGGIMITGTASALLASGCGGDDNKGAPTEAGTGDSTTDGYSPPDVYQQPDVQEMDSQGDVVQGDVQMNDVVVGDDASDSGAAEAGDGGGPDSAAAMKAFPGQVAQALCQKLAECCLGTDASAFDMNGCVTSVTPVGYSGTFLGSVDYINSDAGILAFNPMAAQACLQDIGSIDCTANLLTSQVQVSILNDCVGAIYGTLGAGASCTDTIECGINMYCDLPLDAGTTGTCQPLVGNGGSCYFGSQNPSENFGQSEEACSYRRTGNSGLRCNNAQLDGNPLDGGSNTWTCMQAAPVGSGCNFNQDCLSRLCDPGANPVTNPVFQCVSSETFVYPSACAGFIKDGGTD